MCPRRVSRALRTLRRDSHAVCDKSGVRVWTPELAAGRVAHLGHVGDGEAEPRQLVRVDQRMNRLDYAVAYDERHCADDTPVGVERDDARLAIDQRVANSDIEVTRRLEETLEDQRHPPATGN